MRKKRERTYWMQSFIGLSLPRWPASMKVSPLLFVLFSCPPENVDNTASNLKITKKPCHLQPLIQNGSDWSKTKQNSQKQKQPFPLLFCTFQNMRKGENMDFGLAHSLFILIFASGFLFFFNSSFCILFFSLKSKPCLV